jgi:hypothetical protein
MLHRAFLFDYEAFRRSVAPVVQAVDQGNYEPLYTRAEEITMSTQAEEWPLQDQGTGLESIDPSLGIDSGIIGYWLLVILSTFLSKASSLARWGILRQALVAIGWSEEDSWQIIRGMHTASILKPDIDVGPDTIVRISDPYWFWVFPTQSYQRGWLPLEAIKRLRHKLLVAEPKIMALDLVVKGQLGKESVSTERLRLAFDEAHAMLQSAEESQLGLFMVIS